MSRTALFLTALLALTVHTLACTCFPATFAEHYAGAKTVVKAQVILVKQSPTPKPSPCVKAPCFIVLGDRPVTYMLQVVQIFKGCGPSNLIFFAHSNLRPGFCGFGMKVGETYMLNLYKEVPRPGTALLSFSVNSCQGNKVFSSLTEEQLRFLEVNSEKPKNKCST